MLFYLLFGLLFLAALTAGFAASASFALLRYRPAMSLRRRRVLSSLAGATLTLSPALVKVTHQGIAAWVSVILSIALIAVVAGYPAVRIFEPDRGKP